MMRGLGSVIIVAFLAACGADGAPVAPTAAPAAKTTGLKISGEATFGIAQNGTK